MMLFPLQAQGFALPVIQSPLGLPHVLTLAAALFALGLFTVLAHRNLLRLLMGFELMLLATMINLVAFTTYLHPEGLQGQAITILLGLVALTQLGVGLALVVGLLRTRTETTDALDVDRYDELKW
jgi:NAD(P)H-quinone oxidoreductase subunit 4L